jgi:hypothetical protein
MKKMIIKTKSELNMMKKLMTAEAFDKKFTVCEKLVTKMAAEDAVARIDTIDKIEVSGRRSAQMN